MPLTLAMFLGALYGVLRLQNYRWRLIAADYASRAASPVKAVKRLAFVVATGGGRFYTPYAGVRVEVCEDGLALRLVPPLSAGAPRLFLPFREMKVRRTDWFLNTGSFAISMERGGGVELIIDDELMSWIQANTDKFALAA